MTEIKKTNVYIPAGERVIGDIVLVADENFYSSLKIVGELVGNVSVYRKPMPGGGFYPTNVHVFVSSGGSLIGNISDVDEVDISGEYSGDIKSMVVIIRSGAVVRGNINCSVLCGGNDTEVQGKIITCIRKAIT